MKSLADEVEALVARVGTHPVWGYAHCLRVHALAEELAAELLRQDAAELGQRHPFHAQRFLQLPLGAELPRALRELLLEFAGTIDGLPGDMATQHDHYIHGRPKR
jgi:hypothetical protein